MSVYIHMCPYSAKLTTRLSKGLSALPAPDPWCRYESPRGVRPRAADVLEAFLFCENGDRQTDGRLSRDRERLWMGGARLVMELWFRTKAAAPSRPVSSSKNPTPLDSQLSRCPSGLKHRPTSWLTHLACSVIHSQIPNPWPPGLHSRVCGSTPSPASWRGATRGCAWSAARTRGAEPRSRPHQRRPAVGGGGAGRAARAATRAPGAGRGAGKSCLPWSDRHAVKRWDVTASQWVMTGNEARISARECDYHRYLGDLQSPVIVQPHLVTSWPSAW